MKYDGKELAKILIYYGMISDADEPEKKIICPFHEDKNPSMIVDLSEGTFLCFGCGVHGRSIDFVKAVNPEMNDLGACVEHERILQSNKVNKLQIKIKKKKRIKTKQALIEAYDYFYGLKSVDWNHIETEEEQNTLEYMDKRGFNARALNIADCRVNYNIAYPFIFPILDNGKFMGWLGRTTSRYVEGKRKYLYNTGFKKRFTLCGNYEENCVPVLCEGYMDYLSLRTKAKIKNSVAILGWHISDVQVEKLKQKGIKTVISCLDNDPAGIKGTEYLKKFFDVIRPEFPQGVKDVGEMDGKQIREMLRRTKHGNI